MIERLLRAQAAQLREQGALLTAAADAVATKGAELSRALAVVERLRARLDQLEGLLDPQEPGTVTGTLTMPAELLEGFLGGDTPLCLREHPDVPGVLCELERDHDGPCEGDDPPDVAGSSYTWGGAHSLDDLDDEAGANGLRRLAEESDSPLHRASAAAQADHLDAVAAIRGTEPDYQPDGEPPPEEWGPPAEPRAGETRNRRTDPLHRFRTIWLLTWKAYKIDAKIAGIELPTDARYQVLAAWYDGANTLSDPPYRGGKVPVPSRLYAPAPNNRGPGVVGSLAWLQAINTAEFAAAVDAVLGVER